VARRSFRCASTLAWWRWRAYSRCTDEEGLDALLGWRTKGDDDRILRATGEKDERQSTGHAAVAVRKCRRNLVGSLPRGMPKLVDCR
jgi:hypothetical protein